MIGKALTAMLVSKGYEVIILSRSAKETKEAGVSFAVWDVEKGTIDKNAVAKADYIIHLAGANVAEERWTKKRKEEIVESRTKSGALLVKALRENENKVKALINASAIGWYGPDSKANTGFKEGAPAYDDFLGNTCKVWEESTKAAETPGRRVVYLRTGIVLSKDGGAYAEFRNPLKFGIAAILGSGKQIISWIHIDDLCRMYIYAIAHEISGVYNAVAPKPVSNKSLTLEIAKKVKGKSFIPVHAPTFVLKMMLGEMSVEVLKSTTVNNDKIKSVGFSFLYPSAEAAVNAIEKA